MNKTVNKELQKLAGLCVEINSKTKHDVFFEYAGHIKTLTISVYENGYAKEKNPVRLTSIIGDKVTLPNLNKCRQKLAKYKEW